MKKLLINYITYYIIYCAETYTFLFRLKKADAIEQLFKN
jgi:hypothetical protein